MGDEASRAWADDEERERNETGRNGRIGAKQAGGTDWMGTALMRRNGATGAKNTKPQGIRSRRGSNRTQPRPDPMAARIARRSIARQSQDDGQTIQANTRHERTPHLFIHPHRPDGNETDHASKQRPAGLPVPRVDRAGRMMTRGDRAGRQPSRWARSSRRADPPRCPVIDEHGAMRQASRRDEERARRRRERQPLYHGVRT